MRAGFSFSHGLVPKQICDEGGSYGSWPQVVQGHGGSGYGGVSSSAPREKTRTGREKVTQLQDQMQKVNWIYLHIDIEVRHKLIAAIAR